MFVLLLSTALLCQSTNASLTGRITDPKKAIITDAANLGKIDKLNPAGLVCPDGLRGQRATNATRALRVGIVATAASRDLIAVADRARELRVLDLPERGLKRAAGSLPKRRAVVWAADAPSRFATVPRRRHRRRPLPAKKRERSMAMQTTRVDANNDMSRALRENT